MVIKCLLTTVAVVSAALALGRILGSSVWWPTDVLLDIPAIEGVPFDLKYVRRGSDGVVEWFGPAHGDDPMLLGLAGGMGYVHASERGGQLLLMRLLSRGELCRRTNGLVHLACDPKMRAIDGWMQQLHFARTAAAQEAQLREEASKRTLSTSLETLEHFEAYVAGINARWRETGIPWEFYVALGFPDESRWRWTLEDTLTIAQFYTYVGMAQTQEEIERFVIEASQHGSKATQFVRSLFAPHLDALEGELLTAIRSLNLTANEFHAPKMLHAFPLGFKASNAWSVHRNFTASSDPATKSHAEVSAIFASDPHAQINRLPNLLHEHVYHPIGAEKATLALGDRGGEFMAGLSLVGQPMFGFCRTRNAAWGVTYGYVDSIEFNIEKCRFNPETRKNQCAKRITRQGETDAGSEFEWMDVHTEFSSLHRGPFTPDVDRYIHTIPEAGGAILDSTTPTLELSPPGATSYPLYLSRTIPWNGRSHQAAIDLAKAAIADKSKFSQQNTRVSAMAKAVTVVEMPLNFMVSDSDGNIAMQQTGLFTKHDDPLTAALPALRWKRKTPISAVVPIEELVKVENPSEGFLVVTNENGYNQKGMNLHMGYYRQDRISAEIRRLIAANNVTVESMRNLQIDTYSLQGEKFMEVIKPILAEESRELRRRNPVAFDALKHWDHHYSVDSTGATVFEVVYEVAMREVVNNALGDVAECKHCKHSQPGSETAWEIVREGVIPGVYHHYFDQALLKWTPELDGVAWPSGMSQSAFFEEAIAEAFDALKGQAVKTWGKTNCAPWNNLLVDGHLGPVGQLIGLDGACIPMRGSRACVPQTHLFELGDIGTVASAPMLRWVTDMNDHMGTQSVLGGGASDRFLSQHYMSDVDMWVAGEYKPMIVRA